MDVRLEMVSENHLEELLPLVRAYHEFEKIHISDLEREKAVRCLVSDRALGGIWYVYTDREIAGYIALCVGFSIEFSGFDAFIDEFYIRPEYRGKGIGTKVLELAKAEAKKIGIRALHLEVARTNVTAQNIYSRANFKAREKYVLMSVNL